MGIPPEIFDAVGDMVGAAVGPAMMMGPADAGGGDMGAVMADAVEMMMPEGVPMPPEVGGAMMDMGAAMGDAGVMPHDVASEMMPSPGEPGGMPVDAGGDPLMVPGDPGSVPMMDMNGDPILQAPPADGAMADMGTMMPPPGGYDHAEMTGDMVMPEPYDFSSAEGMPFEMATPDPTGELSGAENIAPVDTAMVDTSGNQNDGGAAALGEALGGDSTTEIADNNGPDQNDVAVGAAMDTATEQGGGQGSGAAQGQDFGNTGEGEESNDSQDVDSSAGMA
jgi:hypothetical protein